MTFDWSVVNTGILMGVAGWLWRQSGRVDALYQAVVGFAGKGGVLEEIRILRERTHQLANTMTTLNLTMQELLAARRDRKDTV